MKTLILLVFFSIPSVIFAQTSDGPSKKDLTTVINPMVGMTFSAFNSEPEGLESKARVGWLVGANFRIGDQFYFEPGLQYVMLNSEFRSISGPIIDTAVLGNTDMNILRIPLMIGVRMLNNENKDNPLNVNVHFGLDLGIITSIDQGNTSLSGDDFKNPILGAIIGAGIDFLSLTFTIDYSYGLTPVFKETYTPFGKEPRANSLYFTLGTKYQL